MPDSQNASQNTVQNVPLIRMEGITKRFPGIVANQGVRLQVLPGAFHAVIGENGAGKSTLLNILYGRYRPDAGQVFLRDTDVTASLRSPADAIQLGIGMVSQHYALIPALTVLENVVLGAEPTLPGGVLNLRAATERIRELAEGLGLPGLDCHVRAEKLSVAAQQKVEILKALYRNASVLLLDEPTATLAPQEADSLFSLLHQLVAEGTTIVFVTHKIREVMTHSDAVTVLRRGRNAGDFVTCDTDPDALLSAMIGPRSEPVSPEPAPPVVGKQETIVITELIDHPSGEDGKEFELTEGELADWGRGFPLLHCYNVAVRNTRGALAVQDVNLEVFPGEIVGVAGVDGSGQRELSEAIVGLLPLAGGVLSWEVLDLEDDLPEGTEPPSSREKGDEVEILDGTTADLSRYSVRERQRLGIAYIPEDRHRAGMVMDFSIAENYLLGHEDKSDWGGGIFLSPSRLLTRADEMIRNYDVRVGDRDATAPGRTLSGGNQQKVVVARAMDSLPSLLVACQPTRGLDRGATEFVYKTLRSARENGTGILLFSLDLDEILELSDRIAVMFNGHIVGILPRAEATAELLGALMTGSAEGEKGRRGDEEQKPLSSPGRASHTEPESGAEKSSFEEGGP